jgi:sphinganine-1-phosphate aldolase
VDKQVSAGITNIETKLAHQEPGLTRYKSLPKQGWSPDVVRAELDKLAGMRHTLWEDGRVSGTVYHGGYDLLRLQMEAYRLFAVSNPIHPDVFPGVRKMEAEIVAMVRICPT